MEQRTTIEMNAFFDVPPIAYIEEIPEDKVNDKLKEFTSLYKENKKIADHLQQQEDLINILPDIAEQHRAIKGMFHGIRMYIDIRETFLRANLAALIEKSKQGSNRNWDEAFRLSVIESETIDKKGGVDGVINELFNIIEEENPFDHYSEETIDYVSSEEETTIKKTIEDYVSPSAWQMIADLDPSIFFELEDADTPPDISTKQKLENLLATLKDRDIRLV
jgi:F0F1-type ATP synthase delta subunit